MLSISAVNAHFIQSKTSNPFHGLQGFTCSANQNPSTLAFSLLSTFLHPIHPAPAPLTYWIFLRYLGHSVALGPLHLHFPVAGKLFLHYHIVCSITPLGLCLNLTLSLRADGTHLAINPFIPICFSSEDFSLYNIAYIDLLILFLPLPFH